MSRADRETGGLADLFGQADEPVVVAEEAPPAGPDRSWVRWTVRNLLLVGVATLVAVALTRLAGFSVPLLLLIAGFIALRLLMLAVEQVAIPPVPTRVSTRGDDGVYRWDSTDSLRTAVGRWERTLQWAQSDPARFSRNVLPVLAELTDERLRLRHGFTRASDPRRARELLGDQLWQLLADPGRRPPKQRDLESCLDVLERL